MIRNTTFDNNLIYDNSGSNWTRSGQVRAIADNIVQYFLHLLVSLCLGIQEEKRLPKLLIPEVKFVNGHCDRTERFCPHK